MASNLLQTYLINAIVLFGYNVINGLCVKIFISYAHEDIDSALFLSQKLSPFHEVFLDEAFLKVGDNFSSTIQKEIIKSDHFILLISKNSAISKYVKYEYEWATFNNINILPILLDSNLTYPPSSFWHLASTNYILFSSLKDPRHYFWQLLGLSVSMSKQKGTNHMKFIVIVVVICLAPIFCIFSPEATRTYIIEYIFNNNSPDDEIIIPTIHSEGSSVTPTEYENVITTPQITEMILFTDSNSLTLYIGNTENGFISLDNFSFHFYTASGIITQSFASYTAFATGLDNLQTPLCIRLQLQNTTTPLQSECRNSIISSSYLAPSDVIWFDRFSGVSYRIEVYYQDEVVAQCQVGQIQCVFLYPTITGE